MSQIIVILSVFFVSTSTFSDYKVYVTKNRYEADLWVCKSNSKYESLGNEEIWFESKSKYESSFSVRYVKSKYQADIIIYYVNSKYDAGWKKNHRLKNNLIIPKK